MRYVFVKLYEDELIYRGIAMVNWCPHCRTAISDIEVEFRERDSKLWEIHYPIEGSDRRLTVGTRDGMPVLHHPAQPYIVSAASFQ